MTELNVLDPYGLAGTPSESWMRQSTIGQLTICQKRVEFDREPGWGYSSGPARLIGQGYHGGLEWLYRWFGSVDFQLQDSADLKDTMRVAGVSALDDEIEKCGDNIAWDDEYPDRDSLLPDIDAMFDAYIDGKHWWDPEEYEVVAVELPFWYPLVDDNLAYVKYGPEHAWVAHGTVDLVLKHRPTGFWVIADHKSAKRKWKSGKHTSRATKQMPFYLKYLPLALAAAGHLVPPMRAYFDIMTRPSVRHLKKGDVHDEPTFERREALVTSAEIEHTNQLACTAAVLIDRGGPFLPNQDSFLCKREYCDHWERCPFGESFSTGTPVPVIDKQGASA